MSTETDENRSGENSGLEENWASDEAAAAQEEMMAEAYRANEDGDGEESSGDRPDSDQDTPPQATDAAEPDDEARAHDGLPQTTDTDTSEDEDPAAEDQPLNANPYLSGDNANPYVPANAAPADEPVPEGVAMPADLGGRNVGASSNPLMGAEAQEEFLSRWTEIQVSFVEDPGAAVESAEALVEEIGAAILTSFQDRSNDLAAERRAATDTEQLRLALRQYRSFLGVILPK